MHYLTQDEVLSLLEVAYKEDRLLHLAALVSIGHGLRITEMRSLTIDDVDGHYLKVAGLKDGEKTLEPLYGSANPLFNELTLAVHAHGIRLADQRLLFGLSRQAWDKKLRRIAELAGLPKAKWHWHALRHTCGHMVFTRTISLGCVQQALRHRSISSSLVYLQEFDAGRAYAAIAQGMVRLWQDEALRRELSVRGLERADGFSWEKTASQTLSAYARA